MRVALFIIILLLGMIISELKIIPTTKPISLLGLLVGIGWGGLLHNYFKSKKNESEFKQAMAKFKMELLAMSKSKKK